MKGRREEPREREKIMRLVVDAVSIVTPKSGKAERDAAVGGALAVSVVDISGWGDVNERE
jgi:hypothetical protein